MCLKNFQPRSCSLDPYLQSVGYVAPVQDTILNDLTKKSVFDIIHLLIKQQAKKKL